MFFPFGGVPAFCMIADMGSGTQTGGKKSGPTPGILRSRTVVVAVLFGLSLRRVPGLRFRLSPPRGPQRRGRVPGDREERGRGEGLHPGRDHPHGLPSPSFLRPAGGLVLPYRDVVRPFRRDLPVPSPCPRGLRGILPVPCAYAVPSVGRRGVGIPCRQSAARHARGLRPPGTGDSSVHHPCGSRIRPSPPGTFVREGGLGRCRVGGLHPGESRLLVRPVPAPRDALPAGSAALGVARARKPPLSSCASSR